MTWRAKESLGQYISLRMWHTKEAVGQGAMVARQKDPEACKLWHTKEILGLDVAQSSFGSPKILGPLSHLVQTMARQGTKRT